MNEILDLLNEPDSNEDVYMLPPEPSELTDEDSADSDDDATHVPHRLPPNLLRAPGEIRQPRVVQDESSDEDDVPLANIRKTKPVKLNFEWNKCGKLSNLQKIFPEPNFTKYKDFSPSQFFELFFDEEIFEEIVQQSNLYSKFKNYATTVTNEEIKTFIGILIVTSFTGGTKSKRDLWANGDDIRNQAIYMSMRRNKFEKLMQVLHFNDNTQLNVNDRYTKMRPLISMLQKRFTEHFIPSRNISHDEAMIEYFGKHNCKQAIRNKPIRFGFKVWCQNTPEGYLVNFEPYQGKFDMNESKNDKFGKCAASVLNLLDKYSEDKMYFPYHIYIDNFFTTLPLIIELKKRGYDCTGTIKSNRVPSDCGLTESKQFNKNSRGDFEETVGCTERGEQILVTRWKDNAVVTVASSLGESCTTKKVSRWCKIEKKKISVPIPNVIDNYNRCMGGTDRMDQNINKCRIGIRGKKWWWCMFTWLLDVSINNAWVLSNTCGIISTQKDFRRRIALRYLEKFGVPPKGPGRKSQSGIEIDQRYDNISHFVKPVNGNKRRRCAAPDCDSVGRTECSKCLVGLCVKCFEGFHTKK